MGDESGARRAEEPNGTGTQKTMEMTTPYVVPRLRAVLIIAIADSNRSTQSEGCRGATADLFAFSISGVHGIYTNWQFHEQQKAAPT